MAGRAEDLIRVTFPLPGSPWLIWTLVLVAGLGHVIQCLLCSGDKPHVLKTFKVGFPLVHCVICQE